MVARKKKQPRKAGRKRRPRLTPAQLIKRIDIPLRERIALFTDACLQDALSKSKGNLSEAARMCDVPVSTLHRWVEQHS